MSADDVCSYGYVHVDDDDHDGDEHGERHITAAFVLHQLSSSYH